MKITLNRDKITHGKPWGLPPMATYALLAFCKDDMTLSGDV